MDVATINSRKQSLKKAIGKSLKGLRVGKNGKLSSSDKRKIKSTVANAYQRYLLNELTTPSTKTYDWWFTVDGKHVDGISHQRNMLGRNRYFIIDQEGSATPINNGFSHASSVGSQRVRELEIYDPEISKIISSSKALFASMLRITVSEKEDRKISAAYDTVDEKMIFTVTLAAPVMIIGAAEALPVLLAFGESTALPSLGKAFALNSGRTAFANGATEFGEQYFNQVILDHDMNPLNVDWADITNSAVFSKPGAMFLNSTIDYSLKDGFEINSLEEASKNMFNRKTKSYLGGKFNKSFSGPIGELSKPMSVFLDKSMNMVFRIGINKVAKSEDYGSRKEE
ncbi:hypothetical protein FGM00_12805 [Aggregatimonas sangjinii]|uniref:Uncharacterized protein n=1 Tax=Aggregatimonas sangjinii TaxID=2583587 RepID=A0A5B7SQV7_9FLAO|nr:hypothetical protein [Aggregatimonas sangjinii]QCX00947.1 hypothetical protein FGM00_12805 [Aggregatimonas sangjinii]